MIKSNTKTSDNCISFFIRVLIVGFFIVVSPEKLSADMLYSQVWNYALDLPEGFETAETDNNKHFIFRHTMLPVYLELKLYDQTEEKKLEDLADKIYTKLNMRHKDINFIWNGKRAILSIVNFIYNKNEQAKEFQGWYLAFELPNEKGFFTLLGYSELAAAKKCESMIISCLDNVFTDESFFSAGAVTSALFPKKEIQEITYTFNSSKIIFTYDSTDMQAAQSIVDREFSLLTLYLNSTHIIDAWKRYYKIIFKDSWNRILPFSQAIGKLLIEQHKLDAETAAVELLTWLQAFKYERHHEGSDFINLTEACLSKTGDCDSRALLMVIILKQLRYDAILLISPIYLHAVAAVDCPRKGAAFDHNGKKYIVAETTAKVELGQIASDIADTLNWFGVDFD